MRNPARIAALAAATLALSGTSTAAADWQGVWRATWPNGHQTELTIVRIDDGKAHGAYCHLTNHGRTSYIDLHPDAVLAKLDNTAANVLRIQAAFAPLDVPSERPREHREHAVPIRGSPTEQDQPHPRQGADLRRPDPTALRARGRGRGPGRRRPCARGPRTLGSRRVGPSPATT